MTQTEETEWWERARYLRCEERDKALLERLLGAPANDVEPDNVDAA